MSKKILAALLATALLVTPLAGCKKDDTGNNSSGSATGGKTITMSHSQGEWMWPSMQKLVDAYKEKSGNTVELLYVPNEEYSTWITSQFAGGTEPDIIFAASQPASDFYKNGWLVDLKPYYEKESPYTNKIWKDSFSGNVLNGTIDSNGSGAMVGMPSNISTVNLYYNEDLCKELGLDVSQPLSWTQVLDYCKIISEKNPDLVPMSVMNSSSWNLGWQTNFMMEQLWYDIVDKVDVVDKNGRIDTPEAAAALKTGVVNMEDQRMIDFFNYMRELSKYFNNGFNTASFEYESLFNEGKAVFNLNGSWYPNQYLQNELTINYGTLPIPYVDTAISDKAENRVRKYSLGLGGPDMMVTTKAMNEGRGEAAINFLQFFSDPNSGSKIVAEDFMWIPVVDGVDVPDELKGITEYVGEDEQKVNWNAAFLGMTAEANEQYNIMFANFLDDDSISAAEMAKNTKELYSEAAEEAIADHEEWDIDAAVNAINGK